MYHRKQPMWVFWCVCMTAILQMKFVTLLWTCPQNHGHMDGGNVESISCCLMLQITYLGVYKCILSPCVMFLHTPRMYFRLQLVCSVSLCSVGFANVDVFLSKCVLQNWPKIARFCSYEHKNWCKLKPAISSFYCFFFHFNWIPGSKVMMF